MPRPTTEKVVPMRDWAAPANHFVPQVLDVCRELEHDAVLPREGHEEMAWALRHTLSHAGKVVPMREEVDIVLQVLDV